MSEKSSATTRRQVARLRTSDPVPRQKKATEPKTATEKQAAQMLAALRGDDDGE